MKTTNKPLQKLIIGLILVAQFSLVVSPAAAHRPEEANFGDITPIPNAATSYAYYQEFTTPYQSHTFEISLEAGQRFHAGINIPALAGLESYGVRMALLGPGLPALDIPNALIFTPHWDMNAPISYTPTNNTIIDFNSLALNNYGGIVVNNQISKDFYEPFTQTEYWGRQSLDIDAPETGTYYLLIWHPQGLPGKYVLDTGYEEVFGPGDLFLFPGWWLNTRLYFEQGPQLALFFSFFLVGIGTMALLGRRRRSALALANN